MAEKLSEAGSASLPITYDVIEALHDEPGRHQLSYRLGSGRGCSLVLARKSVNAMYIIDR